MIPCYNAEKYIRRCLDTIVYKQNLNAEIIVINDGSTDSTQEILEQ